MLRKLPYLLVLLLIYVWATPTLALDLTAAHVNPPGEPTYEAFAKLAKRVNNEIEGLSLTVYPQGQLGTEKETFNQVRIGAIAISEIPSSKLQSFVPIVGVFDIPFLIKDAQHIWTVIDGPIGDMLEQKIEEKTGVTVLGWWSAGFRNVFTRETDVKTPSDLAGLKIRVMGSPVYIDAFNALGAQAVPMPYGEVYTALATGTIDAAENDLSGYQNMKFWEQAPHLSLTRHTFLLKPVIANPEVMKNMTPKQRAEFDQIFAEVTQYQRDLFANVVANNLGALKKEGVTVVEHPDRAAFRKELQPIIEKYSKIYGEDLVQKIRNAAQ